MAFPLNSTVWLRLRERMDARSLTRYEYAALARYWRVRRRAVRRSLTHAHSHYGRDLRIAEENLACAVTVAYVAEKWRPAIRVLNAGILSVNERMREAMKALAPLARALASVSEEER
jgi:hypothetical protein